MGLRDISFKRSYDSDSDDILNDFYIPALSNSISYKRISGFFSSRSLAVAARGISQFIINGGTMQLLCSAKLEEEDLEVIKEAIKSPEKIIEDALLKDLNELEDKFEIDHVRALGWMIANNKLKIKIAIVLDENGIPTTRGILHPKIGILEDRIGDFVCFSGSNNETAPGWQSNVEEFKVFPSWDKALEAYFESDIEKFDDYWSGNTTRTHVVDIPEAVEKKLIEIAPKDFKELKLDKPKHYTMKKKKKIVLRHYQEEAINNWVLKGYKGIFEMATGTGKTFTALGALKHLQKEKDLVTIIASPFGHLVSQWYDAIDAFNIKSDIIIADSTNPNWKNSLSNYLIEIKTGINQDLIILTTHDTVSNPDFIRIIEKYQKNPVFIIIDEVHGIGADKRREGLLPSYEFRLGLSATPSRWSDEEGTDYIFNYFGEVVFEFSLYKAIHTINPDTGETFLTPYIYCPSFIELTDLEIEEYENLTRFIIQQYHSTKNNEEKNELFTKLLVKRAEIIGNAVNKYKKLNEILNGMDNVEYALFYCSHHQLRIVQDILNEMNITQHKFTLEEGTRKKKELGFISERDYLLRKFGNGEYKALVAIKCLDEGVDVPPARIAFLMANSKNPRQYIQRRGRVLRRYEGKREAIIYDMIIVPQSNLLSQDHRDLEKKIMKEEFRRYKEFACLAKNKVECLKLLKEYEIKYL